MNEAAERNRKKQNKNARRGGYTPSIAKDVNKHKVQKLKRMINDLRKEAQSMEMGDLFDKGYQQCLINVADDLSKML